MPVDGGSPLAEGLGQVDVSMFDVYAHAAASGLMAGQLLYRGRWVVLVDGQVVTVAEPTR